MTGDKIVQFLHRHGHAFASGRTLPGLGRAGVVAVAPALAGADGHGPAALGAMDKAGQHRRAADHLRRRHLRVARLHTGLNRIERGLVDNRRNIDLNDFRDGV